MVYYLPASLVCSGKTLLEAKGGLIVELQDNITNRHVTMVKQCHGWYCSNSKDLLFGSFVRTEKKYLNTHFVHMWHVTTMELYEKNEQHQASATPTQHHHHHRSINEIHHWKTVSALTSNLEAKSHTVSAKSSNQPLWGWSEDKYSDSTCGDFLWFSANCSRGKAIWSGVSASSFETRIYNPLWNI